MPNVFYTTVTILVFLMFVLPYTARADQPALALKAGWNMVSSPTNVNMPITDITGAGKCTLGDNSASSTTRKIWYWDSSVAADDKWKTSADASSPITVIEPGKGYWIYANGDCNIVSTGVARPASGKIELKSGWNMVSSPINANVPIADIVGAGKCTLGNGSTMGAVWYWDSTLAAADKWKKSTDTTGGIENIEPGKGYWIYAALPCSVNVTAGAGGIPPAPSGCHETCAAAGDLGIFTAAKNQDTCEIPKGTPDIYSFPSTAGGRAVASVRPDTNNDMDLYVYNDIACTPSSMVCSSTAAGVSTERCSFDITTGKTYYVKILAFNYGDYDPKATAKLTIEPAS